jgi:hypothetical protein
MWRRLIARTHPDAGGSHELFIWAGSVRESVCSGSTSSVPQSESPRPQRPTSKPDPDRVPYSPYAYFSETTAAALRRARKGDVYGDLLALLQDCKPLEHLANEQQRGASYKRLAAIGHMVDMSKEERIGWYRVAESIPLSDRHAGHIIKRLKERAA